jgi:hypothetical protein
VVSTSGTHTARTRGKRPSACNLVLVDSTSITIQHYIWNPADRLFTSGPEHVFPRPIRSIDPASTA